MPRKNNKLEGERLAWFELASHLSMTVESLQDQITYSEFLEWREYLRIKSRRDEKEHYYLAQIAAEVRRTIAKNPKSIKLKEFLFRSESIEDVNQKSEAYKAHRTAMSKGAWFAAIGFQPKPEVN
jgi:hypothetical protein